MIRLLIRFICLLAAVMLGAALSHDRGYVFITMFHYSVETTATVFIIALIITFFIIYQLCCLIKTLNNIPATIRAARERKALKASCHDLNIPLLRAHRLYQENDGLAYIHFYKALTRKQQKNPEILAYYAYFLNAQKHNKAEKVLRKALQANYHDALIIMYARLFEGYDGSENALKERKKDINHAIVFAESLLTQHADSASLQLCLGHLNQIARLWGKAQYHLKESLNIKKTPKAYQILATVYMTLGNKEAACQAYQQGLDLSLHG